MKLSRLCQALVGAKTYNYVDKDVRGIIHDSRRVKKGHLFVAFGGSVANGHDFIGDAIQRGATAIVAEKRASVAASVPQIIVPNGKKALAVLSNCFYEEPSHKLNVIGVTGTNGKTTSTFLIKAILEAAGEQAGLIGTIHYKIGRREIPARETTPESIELQNYFSEMVSQGMKYAVMEVSSHALDQHRVDNIAFKVALFTNLSPEHLDYHETIESYRNVKGKLFEDLAPDSFAVLNKDDPTSDHFAQRFCRRGDSGGNLITYGMYHDADVRAELKAVTLSGATFNLVSDHGRIPVNLPLIGEHNVYNASAAAAVALSLGIDLATIKTGLESVASVPGRLEAVKCGQGFHLYVDYAHTDGGLDSVLSALRPLTPPPGRILLVFGCGGDRDKEKRPRMGAVAQRWADLIWITNDNPRNEAPIKIACEIEAGMKNRDGRHCVQLDREAAIAEAISQAGPGDLVLIAGKGHEHFQIRKDTIVPFDDKDVAQRALARQSQQILQEIPSNVTGRNEIQYK